MEGQWPEEVGGLGMALGRLDQQAALLPMPCASLLCH